jgi:hypothetical protein
MLASRSNQVRSEEQREEILRACSRATSFILQGQDVDGAWRDFRLTPGRSDAWVTAYVGSRLLRSAQKNSGLELPPAIQHALRFLAEARHKSGGWGYNVGCEADADSTAQAILFFRKARYHVPLRDYATLARFQLPDGAFATYKTPRPQHGWGHGHPDVTAVVLQALAAVLPPDHTILLRGYASLDAHLRGRHPWASYWWSSPLYLARELLVLHKSHPEAPRPPILPPQVPQDANCFEIALGLEVALLRNEPFPQVSGMAQRLLTLQEADGGWRSAPILRITDPRSQSLDDAFCRNSPVAGDGRRLFTSATALAALIRYDRLRRN